MLIQKRMKQSIKNTKKKATPAPKTTRPHTTKQTGYKEEVFNGEEQASYNKSSLSKNDKKNTAGPDN